MRHTVACAIAICALATGLCSPLRAQEASSEKIDPYAMKALNDMGTYLRSLKDFQVQAAITNEDVLSDGEKLQFANTTNVLAAHNRLRVDVEGDQKSRLFLYDGKSFTLFARRVGYYATVPAPPTIGELIDVLRDKYDLRGQDAIGAHVGVCRGQSKSVQRFRFHLEPGAERTEIFSARLPADFTSRCLWRL